MTIQSISQPTYSPILPSSTSKELKSIQETPSLTAEVLSILSELPTLLPPRRHDITLALIKVQQNEVDLVNEQMGSHTKHIEQLREKKLALNEARIQKLQEAIAKAKQSDALGWVGKVIGWLSSLFSIALGAAVLIAGAPTGWGIAAGIGLILSGVALLGLQLASDLGIYSRIVDAAIKNDLKKREQVLSQIQLWTSIASIVISVGSLALGAPQILSHGVKTVMAVLQGILLVARGSSTLGKSIIDYQKENIEADTKSLTGQFTITQQKDKEMLNSHKELLDRWKSWTEFAKQILEAEGRRDKTRQQLYS